METGEIEWVGPKLLAFGSFVVDAGKEETISIFVSIVLLIILGDACLCIVAQDVFRYLCEIGLEIIHEVLQLMSSTFEMQLQEHVMGDNDGEGHPIEGTFLDAWLEEVGVVADLLQTHQHIHHACRLIGLLLPVLMPNHLVIQVFLPTTHVATDDGLGLFRQLRLHVFFEPS